MPFAICLQIRFRRSPITQENPNLVGPPRTSSLMTLRSLTKRRWAVVGEKRWHCIFKTTNKYYNEIYTKKMVLCRWAVVGEKDHRGWMRSVLLHQAQTSLPGSRFNAMIHHFTLKIIGSKLLVSYSDIFSFKYTINSGPERECCQKCLKIHIFMGDQLWQQVWFHLTYRLNTGCSYKSPH